MIKLTKENTAKAIERCRQLRPKVKFVDDRIFKVFSSRNTSVYEVRFSVYGNDKFATCNCKASEKGLVCYHIVASAQVNIIRQSVKRQQQNIEMDNAPLIRQRPENERYCGMKI